MKKLLSLLLAIVMMIGVFAVIPVSADEYTEITPNTDFVYNDVKIRFDVVEGHTDSFARILPNGTIEFQIANGDMLWFPDVKVGETSKVVATLTPVETMPAFSGMAYSVKPNDTGRWDFAMVSVLKTAGRRRITNATFENLSKSPTSGDNGNGGNDRAVDQDFSSAEKADGSAWANISYNKNQWDAGKTLSFVADKDGKQVNCVWTSPEYGMLTSSTYDIAEKYPWDGAVGFTVVWQNHGEKHHLILNAMSVLRPSAGANSNGNFYFGDATKQAEYSGLPIVMAGGEIQSLPYTMQKNTEITIDGVKLRFDSYYNHSEKDTKVTINTDGTITARLADGDLLWMPDVKVDATSTIHTEVMFTDTNCGGDHITDYSECHGFGPVWNVTATEQWGLEANMDTDQVVTAAFRSNNDATTTDSYLSIGQLSAARARGESHLREATWIINPDYPECAGFVDVKAAKNGAFGNRIGYNSEASAWDEVLGTTVSFADGKITAKAADVTGLTVATAVYEGADAADYSTGAVGFMMCHAKWDSVYEYTFRSFVVKSALIGEGHKDVCLVGGKNYTEPQENRSTLLIDESTIEIETGIAFFTWRIALTDYTPDGAKLVMKKNGTTVNTVELSTLTPDTNGISMLEYHITCETETDVLTLCLEVEGVLVEGSDSTYAYGEEYAKNSGEVQPPIASENLNCVAYAFDFTDIDMELVPGKNNVGGHTWTYIKNSEDGSAVIKDGKLTFKGSKNDMILFDDLNLNKTNFKMAYDLTYLDTPTTGMWDNYGDDWAKWSEWDAWFGTLVHLSDAATDGSRTAFVQSISPKAPRMMSGTFAQGGGFTVGKTTALGSTTEVDDICSYDCYSAVSAPATGGNDVTYVNARMLGNNVPVTQNVYVGCTGSGYGKIGMTALDNDNGKCYTNMRSQGQSFTNDKRVGKIGFVCSEEAVTVVVDNLEIKVHSTSNMTVDGQAFPIWGGNEIKVESLGRDGNKVIYADFGTDGLKYPGYAFTPNRLTNITTKQVNIISRKATAVAQTGLKWKFEIDKAGYEALRNDPNVKSVKVGMLVVPTVVTAEADGVNRAAQTAAGDAARDLDITASGALDLDVYVFEGIRDIAKDERNTSFSGVGYIQVTMQDDTVVEHFAEFDIAKHAWSLASIVGTFDDEREDTTTAPEGNTTAPINGTTAAPADESKGGCKSTVSGFAMLSVIALAGVACVGTFDGKKKH